MRWGRWRRLVGDTERPDLLDAGKRLLGELDQRRRLGKVTTTLAAQRTLPDGSQIRAAFVGEQPMVEIRAARGPDPDGGPTRLAQGIVLRPEGSAVDALDEALLIPGPPIDPTTRPWRCRFYNGSHVPEPPPELGGRYATTGRGNALFRDGLALGGNLDWRNADGSIVVTFFGPEDRYALNTVSGNHVWGNNNPGRVAASGFLNPYSTLVMVNGDVVMDFADHPDFETFDVVLGACVRDGDLVWCLASIHPDTSDYDLRLYRAPLRRQSVGYPWATGRQRTGPRFQRIDHANTTLVHAVILDRFDYFFLQRSQVFAFNQSATEGRMLTTGPGDVTTGFADATHELVLNFADLDAPTFTDTLIAADVTVVGNVGPGDADHAVLTVVLNGWETTNPADGYKGSLPLRVKHHDYKQTLAHDPALNTIAVDYKDDVPVYLQVRQPVRTNLETLFDADPVCTPGLDSFGTSNTTSGSYAKAWTMALVFPWGEEVALTGSEDYTGAGTASGFYSTTAADRTLATSSSTHTTYHAETAYVLFCDLRFDTVIYGVLRSDATQDVTRATSLAGAGFDELRVDTTTDRTITRTWQVTVHALGEDLVVSAPEVVFTDTTSTPEVTQDPIGNLPFVDNFLSAAHDTGVFVNVGGFNGSAQGEEAYHPFGTALVTAAEAAGIGVPVDAGLTTPPAPFPATADYAPLLGLAQIPDVPWDELHPPTLGWLYSGGGESVSLMPWAKQDVAFAVPLADDAAPPYAFTRESVGAIQVLGDAVVFSIPWPDGTTQRFLSQLTDADFATATGLSAAGQHLPMWLTSRYLTQ